MIVIIPILPKKKQEPKEITYLAPSHIKSQASKPQSQDVNPKSTYLMTTLYHLPSSQSLFIAVSGSTWTHKLWIRERGLSSCPEVSPSLTLVISALPDLTLWSWNCFLTPRNTRSLSHPHPTPGPRPNWGYKENIEGGRTFLISLPSFPPLLFFPQSFIQETHHVCTIFLTQSWSGHFTLL